VLVLLSSALVVISLSCVLVGQNIVKVIVLLGSVLGGQNPMKVIGLPCCGGSVLIGQDPSESDRTLGGHWKEQINGMVLCWPETHTPVEAIGPS